jgi:hypothetical protein
MEPRRAPGVVYAAAVVTWVAAMTTAAFTLLLTVAVFWIAAPVFDAFESGLGNPRTFVVGAAVGVFVLSTSACVVAALVLRGYRWARWVLVGLSVLAALGGLFLAYYVGPLMVTAAAVAVVILLSTPDARAWSRT